MTDKFTIYAAPRNENGGYWIRDSVPLYMKEFASLDAMEAYWSKTIKPASSTRKGLAFELAMVITENSNWYFHQQRRYADKPILRPKVTQANVAQC